MLKHDKTRTGEARRAGFSKIRDDKMNPPEEDMDNGGSNDE
jgi:hypothetical protein